MLTSVHFLEAGFWRYLVGVIFLAFIALRDSLDFKAIKSNISGILLVGIVGLFSFNILLFWGLNFTSSINASLIISLSPMVTLFLTFMIFRTPINFFQIAGAASGFAGVIYLLSQGSLAVLLQMKINKGDALIMLATIIAAFYHIWVKKFSFGFLINHFTFLTNLTCFICFLIILPFLSPVDPVSYPIDFWIAAIAFGSLGTALTYKLWNSGVKLIGPDKAGIFMNLVPLSTAIISFYVGEEITTIHFLSGIMIIVGLIFSNLKTGSFSFLRKKKVESAFEFRREK